MSVEIWKGVCGGGTSGMQYETEVYVRRDADTVVFKQDCGYDTKVDSYVVASESEAIDIALCILKELVPGFIQGEADLVKGLARYKAAYGHLENEVRMLPKE